MLKEMQEKMLTVVGQAKAHKTQHTNTLQKLKALEEEKANTEKALVLAQTVAKQTQSELEYRLSDIVTASLESIFEEDAYTFEIVFEIKRNKTEAKMVFKRQDVEIDPMTASGGGVVEVAALALRLACYLISQPKPAPVFLMDEPAKFLSAEYREKFPKLLQNLSEKLGIQFIMVTHVDQYEVGNMISFE